MNTIPQFKTFFPDMTPEQIVELSFEYFQKINLKKLNINNNKQAFETIITESGLKLRYIIDFTPNQFSFFAMPEGLPK